MKPIYKKYSEQDLKQDRWENLYIVGHVFEASNKAAVDIRDCKFENCDLANLKWNKSFFQNVVFANCRMVGFQSYESNFVNAKFDNCQMKLSNFRFSKMPRTQFFGCKMEESDFYGADLSKATFRKCELSKAQMTTAKLIEADFRGSNVQGLSLRAEDLKGVIVEPDQVPHFSWLLGVTIKEQE